MLVCTVSLHRNLSLWRVIPNASRIPKADSMNKEKNIKVINFITFYKFLITVIRIETTEIIVNAGKLHQENIHAIKNQITSLNSIGRVIIKPSRKSITVVYDARVVSKNEIVSALRQIGYSINRIK